MSKRSSQVQMLIFLVPACFGMWAAIVLPRFEIFGSVVTTIGIIGVIAILYAKVSEKKRTKRLISWGSGEMTKKEKRMYLGGYGVLLLSMVILIFHRGGLL